MFIHDAVIVEVKEDYVEEAAQAIKWYMESPPLEEWFDITPIVPIVADVSIGDDLGTMDERGDIQAVRPSWAQDDDVVSVCAVNPYVEKKKRRRGVNVG